MIRIRRSFEGTGPFSGLALVCWLAGLIFLMSILMSPDGWQWWLDSHTVPGHEIDGLVYYSVHGTSYTLDDPGAPVGSPPHTRTVHYLDSDPSNGSLGNTGTELLDWGSTAGVGLAGVVLMALGILRRRRRSKNTSTAGRAGSYGQGIPEETIRDIVARNRGSAPADPAAG